MPLWLDGGFGVRRSQSLPAVAGRFGLTRSAAKAENQVRGLKTGRRAP